MAKKIVLLTVVLGVVLAAMNYERIFGMFEKPSRTVNEVEVKILLKEDPTFVFLLEELKGKGVLENIAEARDVAKEIELDTNNLAGGKFVILSGSFVKDVLKGFEKDETGKGRSEQLVNVYFNNCRDIEDVSKNISTCIAADSTSLSEYILNPETLEKYGFSLKQMPAMFLPKQYEMEFDTDAEEFVAIMAGKFKEFWAEERLQKLRDVGLNYPSQAVTVASIVYSEQSTKKEEWPIIAKLYLNRLKKGMKLQSDPTFKFCWGDELEGVERLTFKHRDIDCEYNTYKINGLPPGPICITPASVVDAVLNPADVNYLFMCAKPDYSKEHNFTASDREHINNANAYQRWLSAQGK